MPKQAVQNNMEIAQQIKARRNELNLTIEDAAFIADVGAKTWYRYESGEPIRKDKRKGVCKALKWIAIPGDEENSVAWNIIKEYKNGEAWSKELEDAIGPHAAFAFAAGSDIMLDHIKEDMSELAKMPTGTHIGQLDISWLCDTLPEQFLMQYDYNFLYRMKCVLCALRRRARFGGQMQAHTVMDEVLLYLCNEEAKALAELENISEWFEDEENFAFQLADDMDVVTFLYSDMYLTEASPYHFSHWDEQQFWTDKTESDE